MSAYETGTHFFSVWVVVYHILKLVVVLFIHMHMYMIVIRLTALKPSEKVSKQNCDFHETVAVSEVIIYKKTFSELGLEKPKFPLR